MADPKKTPDQTPVAPVAQDGNVQTSTPAVDQHLKDSAEQAIKDGNRTLPGTDPAGKQLSPKLEGGENANGEVNETLNEHPAGLPEVPRQLDNGVRATLPADVVIGPDSPHDNPMPGTNQVNPSAEACVAAGLPLDPTVRQQALSASS